MTERDTSFFGTGWKLPLEIGADGRVGMAEYEEAIRQSIWIILSTAPGERVMRPDFGCAIHDLVFAPMSSDTAGQVATEVRQALLLFEPRIDLDDVTAAPDPDEPNLLTIGITYRVRSTNSRFNLVYPFYLD